MSIGRILPMCALALSGAFAQAASQTSIAITPVGSSIQLPATLIKPDGDGPFPAVVIMHDCSGLGPKSSGAPARWADELVRQGYVVVIPDSFTPRGFAGGVCTISGKERSRVYGNAAKMDAYGALAALRTLPYVDKKNIGIMGGSRGGWAVLTAMRMPHDPYDPIANSKNDPFAAGIALYPGCEFATPGRHDLYTPLAPLLILIGDKDDWTPVEPCRQLAEASRAAGYPVEIKVYPGAYHSFDSGHPVRYDERRNNPNSPSGHGATTGGDPAAWADAKKQVAEFFARYLKSQR